MQELKTQHTDGRLFLVDLDVSKLESIQSAVKTAEELLPNGLDNLISNAGVSNNRMKAFEELYVCLLSITPARVAFYY